jgi:two-component system response regulator PilR (NtrC family)
MPAARILLVEDERDVREVFSIALQGQGYVVDAVDTATEGRDRLNSFRYELVIADWRLPDGNGLDIANKAALVDSKTILMSAYLFQIPAAECAHELMMKPMRPSELVGVAKRLIG